MPPITPGTPKESEKPQPIGNMVLIVLLTTCTMCALFLIWKRADALKRMVTEYRLKPFATSDTGRIRLSEDDGPPAREFIEDDEEDDEGHPTSQDTPLANVGRLPR